MNEAGNEAAPRRVPHEFPIVVIICTFAVTIRIIFLTQWVLNPLFHSPLGDELNFHESAKALLSGDSLQSFLYQPLYTFYLFLVYGLFGVDVAVVRTIQIGIGLGTTLLFYGLGRELGGWSTERGKWIGRASALMVGLYGPLIFMEGQLLAPGITVPLSAGAFWCMLAAGNRERAWLLFPAGLLGGLVLMGRPNLVAILPAVLIWLLVRKWPWVKRATAVGWAVVGLAIGLCPSWIHNAANGQDFVLVSSSGGHSFYLGNNPQATGAFHVPKGERIDDTSHDAYRRSLTALAEQAEGRRLTPAEVSSYWFGRGLEFWADQPGKALWLTGKKALLVVNSEEKPIHHPYVFGKEIVPELAFLVTFGVVFPFFVLGLWLGVRRVPGAGLLAGCVGFYLVSLVLFYVADRYRIVALPMILPLAGLGMVELARRFREKHFRGVWLPLTVLLAAFAVTQIPMSSEGARIKALSVGYNLMGKAAADQGDLANAEKYFQRAVELAGPGRAAVARTNLGLIYERRGAMEAAKQLYTEAARASSQWQMARIRLAQMAEREKDFEEAVRWWSEVAALQAQPGKTLARIEKLKKRIEKPGPPGNDSLP
jgi:4-amino-4-deoxy-L-arabinose transferase-like glycosyltransferase